MMSGNISTVDICDGIHIHIIEDLEDNDGDVEENVGRFIWPTALPMMKYIRDEVLSPSTENTVVVELGAGCGLLGMGLAATHKFHQVIITDHDVFWLQRNLQQNSNMLGAEVGLARLDWGNVTEVEAISNIIRKSIIAIHEPKLLIVASDVLYNHSSHQKLADTLHKLSCQGVTTHILIGFMNDRDNDEEPFLSAAREVFGNTFPASIPVFVERKSKDETKQIKLHLIDFVVS